MLNLAFPGQYYVLHRTCTSNVVLALLVKN